MMKKRILCFGDSNTWGAIACGDGARYPEGVRWTSVLSQQLGEEYVIIEEGQNGRTSVWDDPIENRMAGITYLWPCLESHSPLDLVILMLGTNDTKPYFSVNEKNIADSVGRLAIMAMQSPFGRKKELPVLMVAPIQIINPVPFKGIFDMRSEKISKNFGETFAEVAKQIGCAFLDASLYAKPDTADGVHMDKHGHRMLAEAISAKVKEIL